ncbi:type VI secretion system membrane subunit TssM [Pseudomonas viridiflava]|uniref:type VI secretion system membrane subunit TssM n=1 Tax=Pseudomonas viridiflava TaxID=33069 RepID=UPI000F04936F|nr:type VI secretion system membrane subunit TssM [Pseudomonas viridiflava]
MKTFFTTLGGVLRRAWVWSLLLLMGGGLLIWFVGPRIGVDEYRPLADASARLVTLLILALAWGLFVVFSDGKPVLHTGVSATDNAPEKPATQPDHKGLRLRFKQAQLTLSRARLYRGRSERWRMGLPWYLLLGPQGSGKTSLLEYSGLNLPLNARQNKDIAPPAPTADCDWYFAEQGAVLDVCGGYLTQDDNANASGWQTLLKLIARHRRSKPLNGVVINLPVDLLLAEDQHPLDQLADHVRSRLEEIHQRLHSQSPVYLVVSKADQVRGFDCFYNDADPAQNRQPLGVSFGVAESLDAKVLRLKFDELLSHIGSQIIKRTSSESQAKRVAQVLDFPRQLAMIVAPLAGFMDKAFSGNRFQPGNPLRGVYLTSAPHIFQAKTSVTTSTEGTDKATPRGTRKTGKMHGPTRFIHDLFNQIIFAETGLAVLHQKHIRRLRWRQLAMCGAALACLGTVTTMWAKNFAENSERLTSLNRLGEQLALDRLTPGPANEAFATLPRLERSHAALALFAKPASSLQMLDQQDATLPALIDAYHHELKSQLLPRIATQLANRLRGDLNNREQLGNSLRAYLMLDDLERRDADFMNARISHEWRASYAATPNDQRQLGNHLSRLLQRPVRISLDTALIEQARLALSNTPVAELTYQALKEKNRHLPEYHLNRQIDPYGVVFSADTQAIPGFYTKKSYQHHFLLQGMLLIQESSRDDWVMGEDNQLGLGDTQALMVELEQLYLRDYADHWSRAISQVALVPLSNAGEGAELASRLTAANSPLIQLLVEVRANTRFEAPKADANEPAQADAKTLTTLAKAALPEPLPNNGKMALQRRFEAMHQLLDDDNNPTLELTAALQALNTLHSQLATVARSSHPEQAAFELAKSRMGAQLDGIGIVRSSTSRLPQPLSGWLGAIADDSWRVLLDDTYAHINQRYQSELYSVYEKAIAKRYPFIATSESDVAMADFREFFKAQGLAEKFFDAYLKPFIKSDSTQYRLRSVDGRTLPISINTLSQLGRVQTIRRSFFNEDPERPHFKFRLEPWSLDQNLSRADFQFGDKQLEYRHGPIVPLALQWPAEGDNSSASLIVEHTSGRRVGYQENTGPWSLFRLVERMETEHHSGRDVLMLKANLEERRVNYLLMSQRSPNPFEMGDLRAFKLPAVL